MTVLVKGSGDKDPNANHHPIQKLIAGFCSPLLQQQQQQQQDDEDKTQETLVGSQSGGGGGGGGSGGGGSGENDSVCGFPGGPTSNSRTTNNKSKNRQCIDRGLTIDTSMAGTDDVGIPTTVTMMKKPPASSSFDEVDEDDVDGDDDDDDDIDVTGNTHEQATAMRVEVSNRVRKQRQKYGISIFLGALLSVVTTLYSLKRLGYNIANIDDRQSLFDDGTHFMSELVHYSEVKDDDDGEDNGNEQIEIPMVPPIVRHAQKFFNFEIVWKNQKATTNVIETGTNKFGDRPTTSLKKEEMGTSSSSSSSSSSSIFGSIVTVKRKKEENDGEYREEEKEKSGQSSRVQTSTTTKRQQSETGSGSSCELMVETTVKGGVGKEQEEEEDDDESGQDETNEA